MFLHSNYAKPLVAPKERSGVIKHTTSITLALATVLIPLSTQEEVLEEISTETVVLSQLHASATDSIISRAQARRAQRLRLRGRIDLPRRSQTRRNLRRMTTRQKKATQTQPLSILKRSIDRRTKRLSNQVVPLKLQVIDATNLERAKHGLAPLRYNPKLELSAQRHAKDMDKRGYFAHTNPDGMRSSDRIQKTGYGHVDVKGCRCSYKLFLGENIAKGQDSVAQVVREWMESESHREAILSKEYKEIGIGIVKNIWVQNFGGLEILSR